MNQINRINKTNQIDQTDRTACPLESRGYFPMRTAYLSVHGATQWHLCVNDTDMGLQTGFEVKRGNSL
jgi:hypothetical protein